MTFEEFQAKKRNGALLNRPVQKEKPQMSFEEFKSRKQEGTLFEKPSAPKKEIEAQNPETIKSKMNSLWEDTPAQPPKPVTQPNFKPLDVREFVTDIGRTDKARKVKADIERDSLQKQINKKEDEYATANNIRDWNAKHIEQERIGKELNTLRDKIKANKVKRDSLYKNEILTPEEVEERNKQAPFPQKVDKFFKWDLPQAVEKTGRTGLDLGVNFLTGAERGIEGLVDAGVTLGGGTVANIMDNPLTKAIRGGKPNTLADNIRKKTADFVKEDFAGGTQEILDENAKKGAGIYRPEIFGVPLRNVSSEAGRMLTVAPGGVAGFVGSAGGAGAQEALNEGQSLNRATAYGALYGGVEGATEKMFDALGFFNKGGFFDKFLPKKAITKFIAGAGGEAVEEMVSEAVNPFLKMGTYEGDTENPFESKESAKEYIKNVFRAGKEGAVVSLVLQGGGDISNAEARQAYKNDVISAIDKVKGLNPESKAEMKSALEEVMQEDIENYKQNSEVNKYILKNQVANSFPKNINVESKLMAKKASPQMPIIDSKIGANTILPNNQEMAQKTNMEQIAPIAENMPEIDTKLSKSENISYKNGKKSQRNMIIPQNTTLVDSAEKYNIDPESEAVQSINNAMARRGIESRFDDKLFKDSKENAIWTTKVDENGNKVREVIFNPNSDSEKTIQQIAIHELTHDLTGTKEFEDLSNLILQKNRTRPGHSMARKNLEDIYSQVYDKKADNFRELVDEEEVADTLGQKLSDQKFIDNLSIQQPSTFKKVYNWVVDKLNKFTGGKIEKLYWEDVKNKFEIAYEKTNKLSKTNAQYSIEENNNRKAEQLKIVQKYNPMADDYHVGIRDTSDIKTFEEAINDDESFTWGDFSKEDAEQALKTGKVVVYSSKPIEQGGFVSTSKIQAEEYAGGVGKEIYSKEINPADVAWINGDEGQYAKTDTQYNTDSNKSLENQLNELKGKREKTSRFSPEYSPLSKQIQEIEDRIRMKKENFEGNLEEYQDNKEKLAKQREMQSAEKRNKLEELRKKQKLAQEEMGYKMQHRPNDEGSIASELSELPKDFYNKPEKYFDMTKAEHQESFNVLKEIKGNPDAEITIYRATTGDKINSGDWVTLSEKYAELHNNSSLKGKGKVISQKVKAKDIKFAGDDINEFGYFPEDTQYSIGEATDNKGRTLSKEQQEFFKDSKVRDEKGNLRTLFHQTDKDFTVFDTNKRTHSQGDAQMPDGIFLKETSDNIGIGDNKKQMEVYVKMDNPLIADSRDSIKNKISNEKYDNLEKEMMNNTEKYDKEYRELFKEKRQAMSNKDIESFKKLSDEITKLTETYREENNKLGNEAREILTEELKKQGYDGVIVENDMGSYGRKVKSYIAFNSNQIKNVDNVKPTTDEDIRYSQDKFSGEWERFLREEIGEAQGEKIKDLKKVETKEEETDTKPVESKEDRLEELRNNINLSKSQKYQLSKINKLSLMLSKTYGLNKQDTKIALNEYTKNYKDSNAKGKLLKEMGTEILGKQANKDILKEIFQLDKELDTINRYEEDKVAKEEIEMNPSDIKELYAKKKEYQKAYEKSQKDILLTKADRVQLDRLLKGEITLSNLPKNSNKEQIKKAYELRKPLFETEKQIKDFNNAVKEKRNKKMRELTEESLLWKDKRSGLAYARETQERNIEDIAPKAQADRIKKEIFTPIHKHEAEATRYKNEIKDKIRALNIGTKPIYDISYENSQGVKYDKVSESALVQLYGEGSINDAELDRLGADKAKIKKSVEVFREIYNGLYNKVNETLIANGYPPVEFRKDYFPHFEETKPTTLIGKALSKLGFNIDMQELPTDIAGITHTFRPGKKWVGNFLRRSKDIATYDALKGADIYIDSVADVIYHTDDIQNLRAFENAIRYQHSDEATKERIDEIRESDESLEAKQSLIDQVYATAENSLAHYVTDLRAYTDNLAGKKSLEDRTMEHDLGRGIHNITKALQKRTSANMVGANIASALTNFIPLTQATAVIDTKHLLSGMYDTIKSNIKNDGFAEQSDFLTNRRGSDKLVKTTTDKLSDATNLMQVFDDITSEMINRARYYQNVSNGMSEDMARTEADEMTAKMMADRSKGSMPTLFNQNNPIKKMFTAFQLEVNNQYSYILKDIPKEYKDKMIGQMVWAFAKMFIGAWAYNEVYEKLTGRRSALDPIDIVSETIGDVAKGKKKTEVARNLGKEVAQEVPFVGGLLDGGRVPISTALPNLKDTAIATVSLADEGDHTRAKNTIKKELSKPLYYIIPPFGGGQVKKAVEGISTYAKGGNYGVDSKGKETLKYPVEQNVPNFIKSALFGKWSTQGAKDYIDSGFKGLSANQTEAYKKAIEKGIKPKTFYEAYEAQQNIQSDKDRKGKTIPNSRSEKAKKAIDKATPGMNKTQRTILYDAFNVSKKVR